jgi:hypothetical protein
MLESASRFKSHLRAEISAASSKAVPYKALQHQNRTRGRNTAIILPAYVYLQDIGRARLRDGVGVVGIFVGFESGIGARRVCKGKLKHDDSDDIRRQKACRARTSVHYVKQQVVHHFYEHLRRPHN